jgi:hypothetical protein
MSRARPMGLATGSNRNFDADSEVARTAVGVELRASTSSTSSRTRNVRHLGSAPYSLGLSVRLESVSSLTQCKAGLRCCIQSSTRGSQVSVAQQCCWCRCSLLVDSGSGSGLRPGVELCGQPAGHDEDPRRPGCTTQDHAQDPQGRKGTERSRSDDGRALRPRSRQSIQPVLSLSASSRCRAAAAMPSYCIVDVTLFCRYK